MPLLLPADQPPSQSQGHPVFHVADPDTANADFVVLDEGLAERIRVGKARH
ncbi:hypothetical protein [Streptomyces sp. NPDC048710]|uniref:hypothetical protein n=1 Tax=Streptomyces sp. NPDC048710 TaxID=3365586 RepID=UPI00371337E3